MAKGPNRPSSLSYGKKEPVSRPTDEQLLTAHLDGQSESFELLVRRHSPELYRFLVRLTGSAAAAEDLVQETFLQVHLSSESFDCTRRFKPWVFTIAANKGRDLLRKWGRRPEVPLDAFVSSEEDEGQCFRDFLADVSELPEEAMERGEEEEFIRTLMMQLPDHLREVLVLGYYHRFAYKEIADILNVPLGTVKSRLHTAVGRLGEAYRQKLREKQKT
jgi:RNA polymerase sigma-70 factor, ECF subfamily